MIKIMLVATDGSNHSQKAVALASEIAAALKAKIIILSVVKQQDLPAEFTQYANAEHISGATLDILKKIAGEQIANAENAAKLKGVTDISGEVEEGPIARTIVARAKHHNADMIVIGSRGMGSVDATLRGGVSHRVEILAKCPVLTVK
jgi:nucleotide-binding universal stress UspA family protein